MKKIRISPLAPPTLLITFLLGVHKPYLLAFFTALFHELGHLIACSGEGVNIVCVKLEPFGISFVLKEEFFKSPGAEIKIALAGPLVNFLLAFIFLFFGEKGTFFVTSNLFMGFFNLLPCLPLDGGRVLKALLCDSCGYLSGYKKALLVSRIISMLLVLLGVYLLFETGFNFSLIIIGAFLFFSLFGGKNHSMKYLLKEIYEYKEKERRLEKMKIRHIAVSKDFEVRKILDSLTLSGYHIFTVIEGGRVIKSFTEGELFEALIKKGTRLKISEI